LRGRGCLIGKQIDDIDGPVRADRGIKPVENGAERRIVEQASVPVGFAVDHRHGKRRRQAAARDDVVQGQSLFMAVEIRDLSGLHIGRAHQQSRRGFRIRKSLEIDQLGERLAERFVS